MKVSRQRVVLLLLQLTESKRVPFPLSLPMCSDAASFLAAGEGNHNGCQKQTINLKKSQLFIKFPFIWFNNLTSVEGI